MAEEAARFAKADLSSEMVYEFPELQGLMGRYYAVIAEITAMADLPAAEYGVRAEVLAKLLQANMPVPRGFAVSKSAVHKLAIGELPDLSVFNDVLKPGVLYSVRRSPEQRNWGGPRAILNIGVNDETRDVLAQDLGLDRANDLYCRSIRSDV